MGSNPAASLRPLHARTENSGERDKAMDQFIIPITATKDKPPNPAKVKAAFNVYMEKLRLAD